MTLETDPVVSVIVPARNEEACLASCLNSLVSQTGIPFEIIVVNDASTDRTRDIAESFADRTKTNGSRPPVFVISAPPLGDGWIGKNNAMSAGAKAAKGKWLLFTDADTVHSPGSLARAVAEAVQHGAALLSYSPEQEVRSFWEKAVLPVVFSELAATFPPRKVSDPAHSVAAANGQYLLIARESYDDIGGLAAISGNLLEDVSIARLVKSSGRRIRFRFGGDAVRTRMYRSWPQVKEGWTKNLALLFPHTIRAAFAAALRWILTLAGIVAILLAIMRVVLAGLPPATSLLALAFPLAVLMRIRRAHFSWDATLLALLFGQPVFVYLLLRSRSRMKHGGITWKGREYSTRSTEVETSERKPTGAGTNISGYL